MDLSILTSLLPAEDVLVNLALVSIVVLIGRLLWDMRSDGRKRRRDKAADTFDRFQDQ